MNKIIAVVLCICLLIAPVYVHAADYPKETLIMMGDLNGDRVVSATDARLALRMAAGLESKENADMLSVDADDNGIITASDARIILRKAASLSQFSTGFDADSTANAINAIRKNRYTIKAETEEMNFTIVLDGDNIYLETSDLSFSTPGNGNSSQKWTDMGLMMLDDEFYFTFSTNSKKCAWKFSEAAIKILENSGDDSFSIDEIFSMATMISGLLPEEGTAPEVIETDGETMFCYRSETNSSAIFVDSAGRLKEIHDYNENGKVESKILVKSFSAEADKEYFNTDKFDSIQWF